MTAAPRTETFAEPEESAAELTPGPRLWLLIVLTGVGAGLTSGLLMKLLRLVQHLSFHYRQGDFLSGVQGVDGLHRVMVLGGAGRRVRLALLRCGR